MSNLIYDGGVRRRKWKELFDEEDIAYGDNSLETWENWNMRATSTESAHAALSTTSSKQPHRSTLLLLQSSEFSQRHTILPLNTLLRTDIHDGMQSLSCIFCLLAIQWFVLLCFATILVIFKPTKMMKVENDITGLIVIFALEFVTGMSVAFWWSCQTRTVMSPSPSPSTSTSTLTRTLTSRTTTVVMTVDTGELVDNKTCSTTSFCLPLAYTLVQWILTGVAGAVYFYISINGTSSSPSSPSSPDSFRAALLLLQCCLAVWLTHVTTAAGYKWAPDHVNSWCGCRSVLCGCGVWGYPIFMSFFMSILVAGLTSWWVIESFAAAAGAGGGGGGRGSSGGGSGGGIPWSNGSNNTTNVDSVTNLLQDIWWSCSVSILTLLSVVWSIRRVSISLNPRHFLRGAVQSAIPLITVLGVETCRGVRRYYDVSLRRRKERSRTIDRMEKISISTSIDEGSGRKNDDVGNMYSAMEEEDYDDIERGRRRSPLRSNAAVINDLPSNMTPYPNNLLDQGTSNQWSIPMRGEPCSDSSDADDEDDEERESGERESGERKSGERVATFRAARGLIPTPLTNANVPPLTQPIPGSGFFDLDSAVDQRTIGYEDYTSSSVGDLSDFAESIATSIHGSRNGSTIDGNDPIDDLERELDTLIQDVWMQLEKATSMYERLSTVDDPTVAELHAVLRTFWSVTNDAAAYRRAFADIPGVTALIQNEIRRVEALSWQWQFIVCCQPQLDMPFEAVIAGDSAVQLFRSVNDTELEIEVLKELIVPLLRCHVNQEKQKKEREMREQEGCLAKERGVGSSKPWRTFDYVSRCLVVLDRLLEVGGNKEEMSRYRKRRFEYQKVCNGEATIFAVKANGQNSSSDTFDVVVHVDNEICIMHT